MSRAKMVVKLNGITVANGVIVLILLIVIANQCGAKGFGFKSRGGGSKSKSKSSNNRQHSSGGYYHSNSQGSTSHNIPPLNIPRIEILPSYEHNFQQIPQGAFDFLNPPKKQRLLDLENDMTLAQILAFSHKWNLRHNLKSDDIPDNVHRMVERIEKEDAMKKLNANATAHTPTDVKSETVLPLNANVNNTQIISTRTNENDKSNESTLTRTPVAYYDESKIIPNDLKNNVLPSKALLIQNKMITNSAHSNVFNLFNAFIIILFYFILCKYTFTN